MNCRAAVVVAATAGDVAEAVAVAVAAQTVLMDLVARRRGLARRWPAKP